MDGNVVSAMGVELGAALEASEMDGRLVSAMGAKLGAALETSAVLEGGNGFGLLLLLSLELGNVGLDLLGDLCLLGSTRTGCIWAAQGFIEPLRQLPHGLCQF